MKFDGEIMEILAAYDLTGSLRAAAELTGCSHHTVARHVAARDAGQPIAEPVYRGRVTDAFLPKIEEWIEASKGKIRADKAHEKLRALGYEGSERSTRRAIAQVRAAYRLGHVRVHRPWVTEPGQWIQYDFGDGPVIEGKKTVLFVAWLAWSRFRIVIALRDRTAPSVFAALDRTFRAIGGAPTYVLTDYVPRNIIRLLCPVRLCGQGLPVPGCGGWFGRFRPHNNQRFESQVSSDSSDLQTGVGRDAAEVPGGSVARRASIFVLVLISA